MATSRTTPSISKTAVQQYIQMKETGANEKMLAGNVRVIARGVGCTELLDVISEGKFDRLQEDFEALAEFYNIDVE